MIFRNPEPGTPNPSFLVLNPEPGTPEPVLTTRTIHVDTRYMLWVMGKVDGAEHLIQEMERVE